MFLPTENSQQFFRNINSLHYCKLRTFCRIIYNTQVVLERIKFTASSMIHSIEKFWCSMFVTLTALSGKVAVYLSS